MLHAEAHLEERPEATDGSRVAEPLSPSSTAEDGAKAEHEVRSDASQGEPGTSVLRVGAIVSLFALLSQAGAIVHIIEKFAHVITFFEWLLPTVREHVARSWNG